MNNTALLLAAMLILAFTSTAVPGDDFEIDWYTIDDGGARWSTGGGFELGGTHRQGVGIRGHEALRKKWSGQYSHYYGPVANGE